MEDRQISKKVAIIISIILFIILTALIICEKTWPTGGSDLIGNLFCSEKERWHTGYIPDRKN